MKIRRFRQVIFATGTLLVAPLALIFDSAAQTTPPVINPLYNFLGGFSDGSYPDTVAGKDGILYGTTASGGTFNAGTIFRLTPPASPGGTWTETILYNFTAGNDGASPIGRLVIGPEGVLYGTASGGQAYGVVYSLKPPKSPGATWIETVLHNFTGGTDGANPLGGVVMGESGILYGTTDAGGLGACFFYPSGCGTVFSLSPPSSPGGTWTENVLYSFNGGNDGRGPNSSVVIGTNGVLYGTTVAGGPADTGTVFSLAPPLSSGDPWKKAVIYYLAGGNLGLPPRIVLGPRGIIFGVSGGGFGHGIVFALTPPKSSGSGWIPNVLYEFMGSPDGDNPSGIVVLPGPVIYGTTSGGGTTQDGTVFSLTPPPSPGGAWTENVLASFTFGDGISPIAGVTVGHNGVLYGTANGGGAFGSGTVFSLVP